MSAKGPVRMANKEARDAHALLLELGWVCEGGNAHLRYSHPTVEGMMTLAQTPSDPRWKASLLTKLRRLHNDPTIGRDDSELRSGPKRPPRRRTVRRRPGDVVVLQRRAKPLGLILSREQAKALLKRQGSLSAATTFLHRLVKAAAR